MDAQTYLHKAEVKANRREGDRAILYKDIVFLPLRGGCTKTQKKKKKKVKEN